jgi:hypothetical protein
MREPFAIEAVLELAPGTDPRAIGGAVTLALCGAFTHPGPCPVAPHRTSVEQRDGRTWARIVAACEADERAAVVSAMTTALDAGRLTDPDGVDQRWTLEACRTAPLLDDERVLADRFASSA